MAKTGFGSIKEGVNRRKCESIKNTINKTSDRPQEEDLEALSKQRSFQWGGVAVLIITKISDNVKPIFTLRIPVLHIVE